MKIKIDEHGHLYIERAGKFKIQFCPYMSNASGERYPCNDQCPILDNPRPTSNSFGNDPNPTHIIINGCKFQYVVEMDNFIDERQNAKKQIKLKYATPKPPENRIWGKPKK